MTQPNFRALCAELLAALETEGYTHWTINPGEDPLCERARAALATPPRLTPPPLAPDYIDPEHHGENRELLQVFYAACNAEGGTADEIHLRGIRAVMAARTALATPPPEPPTDEDLLKLTENVSTKHLYAYKSLPSNWDFGDYCSSPQGLIDFARAVLERWGR